VREEKVQATEAVPDIEPFVAAMLDRRLRNRALPAYEPVSVANLEKRLQAFLARRLPGARVEGLARMAGGGSKEQFRFEISGAGARDGSHVLRMDPREGVVETDRTREFTLLRAMEARVPVPRAVWLDAEGGELGRPSIIMSFVAGVIKPSDGATGNITGTGLVFDARWRAILAPQFLDMLAAIHAFDWRTLPDALFPAPRADPFQPALWQVNWWSRVWREDSVAAMPLVAVAEAWMRDNLPACREPVLVHGDFRSGNFLFDEREQTVSAMLDWELAHVGDPHEDLAWILQNHVEEDGVRYQSGLITEAALIDGYVRLTGRRVDRAALHFYRVLGAYKCLVIAGATALRVARERHSHQDILLSWMASVSHAIQAELCRLLKEATPQ
jgi:aminoglycoside phosphotransferase (APT) family kinase protein